MNRYMIVEHFYKDKIKTLYERFAEHGRLLPAGVVYVNSWIDEKVETCFQLMESESPEKLQEWIEKWSDLADFEVFPVISSDEAQAIALK